MRWKRITSRPPPSLASTRPPPPRRSSDRPSSMSRTISSRGHCLGISRFENAGSERPSATTTGPTSSIREISPCGHSLPIRPLVCSSGDTLLARRYLPSRVCQGLLRSRSPRGARPQLPSGLGASRDGLGTGCARRPGVAGGKGVRAAYKSSQTDGCRARASEHRLRGPVRRRHQATRLRGIGTGRIERRPAPQRCSSWCIRYGLVQSGGIPAGGCAASLSLAERLERQRVDARAVGGRSCDPDTRSVRRNDHETKPSPLCL